MNSPTIKNLILAEIDQLTSEQQNQLLAMARWLRTSTVPSGTSGNILIDYMDSFEFESGAVDEMMQAIEEGCERIDWDEWRWSSVT